MINSKELDDLIKKAGQEALRYNSQEITTDFFAMAMFANDTEAKKLVESLFPNVSLIIYETLAEKYTDNGHNTLEVGALPFSKDMTRIFKIVDIEIKTGKFKTVDKPSSIEMLIAFLLDVEKTRVKEILTKIGLTPKMLMDAKISLKTQKGKSKTTKTGSKKTPILDEYARNINEEVKEGKIDSIIGREKEIERVIEILGRKKKNNPVLIGNAGVGKTTIAEGLALKIVNGNVPQPMLDKIIFELNINDIVAGTKYRGQFEERMKVIMKEVIDHPEVILFIDEFHTIVSAGNHEGGLDVSNVMKPHLAKGNVQCIGATTLDEYRKYIEKDPALDRRMQKVMVDEPSVEESKEMLKKIAVDENGYEAFHNLKYDQEAIDACVDLSIRYITDRYLPDKAIDVLDESGSRMKMKNSKEEPEDAKALRAAITLIEDSIAKEKQAKNFEKCIELKNQKEDLLNQLESLENNAKETNIIVKRSDIEETISIMTGIPVSRISESEIEKLKRMENELGEIIIGQDPAIKSLAMSIKRSRINQKNSKKPIGSFVFLGKSGVGKTELAKQLAKFLFNTEDALIKVDMSEYMEKHSVSKLVGAPPGYVGYDQAGQLTEKIRRKPYSVLLFDEIEKAHPEVFNMFLQVLDEGVLTDAQGRKVNFKNTIIIFTSNIGTSFAGKGTFGFVSPKSKKDQAFKSVIMDSFKNKFPKEWVNRIDEVVIFDELSKEDLYKILDINLNEIKNNMLINRQITMNYDDSVKDFLIEKGYDPDYGARELQRTVQRYIENNITDKILNEEIKDGDTIDLTIKENQISFIKKEDSSLNIQPVTV